MLYFPRTRFCLLGVLGVCLVLIVDCRICIFSFPGLLSLSTKFLPTVMNLLRKLAEEGQKPAAPEPQRNRPVAATSFQSGSNNNGDVSSTASSEVTWSENGTEYTSPSRHENLK